MPGLIALLLPVIAACAGPSEEAEGPVLVRLPGAVTDLVRLNDRARTMVAAVDRGRGLYRGQDRGATWRAVKYLEPGVSLAAYSLAALPDGKTVVAGTSWGLAHSSDAGRIWGFVWEGRPGAFGLTLDPDGWPIVAAQDGVRFADGRGLDWEPSPARLAGVSFLTVAADPADRNRVVAGTSGAGVVVSPDRGESWVPVYPTRATVNRLVYGGDGAVTGLAGGAILRWPDLAADPRIISLPASWGRPISLAADERTVYVGTTTGHLLALDPALVPIDRLPAPISAIGAFSDDVCAGTTDGVVACFDRPVETR